RDGRGFYYEFEGFEEHEPDFSQLGINPTVLQPGEPMGMYHWEARATVRECFPKGRSPGGEQETVHEPPNPDCTCTTPKGGQRSVS
ncbi:MAG: hypothetical protein WKF65_17685, partial [Gaiellaceae bacterium]